MKLPFVRVWTTFLLKNFGTLYASILFLKAPSDGISYNQFLKHVALKIILLPYPLPISYNFPRCSDWISPTHLSKPSTWCSIPCLSHSIENTLVVIQYNEHELFPQNEVPPPSTSKRGRGPPPPKADGATWQKGADTCPTHPTRWGHTRPAPRGRYSKSQEGSIQENRDHNPKRTNRLHAFCMFFYSIFK